MFWSGSVWKWWCISSLIHFYNAEWGYVTHTASGLAYVLNFCATHMCALITLVSVSPWICPVMNGKYFYKFAVTYWNKVQIWNDITFSLGMQISFPLIWMIKYTNNCKDITHYNPMSMVAADTGVWVGAEACRTLISHVSSNCDTENWLGSFRILDAKAFCTAHKNCVELCSWGAMWHRGGLRG